jgi:hypothetical protein
MKFGEAIEAMKSGSSVSRMRWTGAETILHGMRSGSGTADTPRPGLLSIQMRSISFESA